VEDREEYRSLGKREFGGVGSAARQSWRRSTPEGKLGDPNVGSVLAEDDGLGLPANAIVDAARTGHL
jgi:hypothetical protein